jgi:DNA invertase Pin-like site-specific DNA recombinase
VSKRLIDPWLDHYHDTGCELQPRCLSCKLPVCKHDLPTRSRALAHAQQRYIAIRQARKASGASYLALARQFGCGTRTVYRALHGRRER